MSTLNIYILSEDQLPFFQDKDFSVSVEGWSKPRLVHWRGADLFFEATAQDCLCNTCIRRFESVLFALKRKRVSYEVGTWSKKDCSIKFNNPKGFDESKIASFLSKRLGLKVTIIEEIPIKKPAD